MMADHLAKVDANYVQMESIDEEDELHEIGSVYSDFIFIPPVAICLLVHLQE